MRRILPGLGILLLAVCLCRGAAWSEEAAVNVPVLAYHRFGPAVTDSMTVTTTVFESQLKWLADNQYKVIPLRALVDRLRGEGPPLPPKSVVITVDDGHGSVYCDMAPIVRKLGIPVTLFIYPSAISNASYAMTREQLQELRETGLFDVQSHTYWHPNFKKEREKLSPDACRKFVETQLQKSKNVLEKWFGGRVDLLAWPFGIYDDSLERDAEKAGYAAAFSIDRRHVSASEEMMALPRYLMANGDGTKGFEAIVTGRAAEKAPAPHRRSGP